MLVAFRLAGLSALEAHYAGVKGRAQMRGVRQARLTALTPPWRRVGAPS
jgi:hypothetical protein